jgi:hypothetical protein
MEKRAGPVAEISLERGEISLTGMEISPYKHWLSLKAGTGNRGTERNGIEERNGTRKAGIFKTRNEKSRNL